MPLIQSSTNAARNANIKTLLAEKKSINQALAIAYSIQLKLK
jgi:hypothetical protein